MGNNQSKQIDQGDVPYHEKQKNKPELRGYSRRAVRRFRVAYKGRKKALYVARCIAACEKRRSFQTAKGIPEELVSIVRGIVEQTLPGAAEQNNGEPLHTEPVFSAPPSIHNNSSKESADAQAEKVSDRLQSEKSGKRDDFPFHPRTDSNDAIIRQALDSLSAFDV